MRTLTAITDNPLKRAPFAQMGRQKKRAARKVSGRPVVWGIPRRGPQLL